MSNDQISMRQMMVLLFVALLSPAIRVLPAHTARLGGRAGWLSSLLALPVLLALCWVLFALFRGTQEGTSLGERMQQTLGKPLGKALIAIYLLWGMFLLCANIRLFGLRFLSTSYRNAPLGMFMVVIAALVLWIARKKISAFARAAEIFFLALALILAVALLFGLLHVEPENLFPIWVADAPGALFATGPALSVLSYAIFAAFFAGNVTRRPQNRRRCMKWGTALCLVLTLIQLVCLGNFGPGLTARMDTPFFMMVKGIGMRGAFERIESLVIALWVLSDLALLALLAFACCGMAQTLFGLRERTCAAIPVVIVALAGAFLLFPNAFALSAYMEQLACTVGLLLGFAVPAILAVIAWLRRGR